MKADKKDSNHNIADQIMDAVEGDSLKMRPKQYFYCAGAGLVVSLAVSFGLTAIFLSMLYREVATGRSIEWVELTGGRGELLSNLPYMLVMALVVAILTSFYLFKRFDFSYKHRSNILALAAVLSLAMLSVGTYHMRLDRRLAFDGSRQLSPLRHLNDQRIVSGEVVAITDGQITIATSGKTVLVVLKDSTRMPPKLDISTGDYIKVFGKKNGETFEAYGIAPDVKIIDRDAYRWIRPKHQPKPAPAI